MNSVATSPSNPQALQVVAPLTLAKGTSRGSMPLPTAEAWICATKGLGVPSLTALWPCRTLNAAACGMMSMVVAVAAASCAFVYVS